VGDTVDANVQFMTVMATKMPFIGRRCTVDANVQFMTVMATKMPYIGRG